MGRPIACRKSKTSSAGQLWSTLNPEKSESKEVSVIPRTSQKEGRELSSSWWTSSSLLDESCGTSWLFRYAMSQDLFK